MFLTYVFIGLLVIYGAFFIYKFAKVFIKNFKKRYAAIKAKRNTDKDDEE